MYVQIVCSVLHVLWNYIFVMKLKLGVVGSGFASVITNFLILAGNVVFTRYKEELENAYTVSIFEK